MSIHLYTRMRYFEMSIAACLWLCVCVCVQVAESMEYSRQRQQNPVPSVYRYLYILTPPHKVCVGDFMKALPRTVFSKGLSPEHRCVTVSDV